MSLLSWLPGKGDILQQSLYFCVYAGYPGGAAKICMYAGVICSVRETRE